MGVYNKRKERESYKHVGCLGKEYGSRPIIIVLVWAVSPHDSDAGFMQGTYNLAEDEYFLIDERNRLVSDWESETYVI